MAVNWDILQPVDVGARFQQGYDSGVARRTSAEDRQFLLEERRRAEQGRSARSDYMIANLPGRNVAGSPNALSPAGPSAQPNALMLPPPQTRPNDFGTPPTSTPSAVPPPASVNALASPSAGPAPALGPSASIATPEQPAATAPMSERDQAFIRFIKTDPAGASEVQRQEATDHHQRLQNFEALNNMGMQILAGVHDQASWVAGRARARALYIRFGEDPAPIDQLPAQWSPELTDQLRMQGMSTQHQLTGLLQHMRLNWDIQDDQTDNAREQQNTDSLIDYRGAEVSLGRDRNTIARDRNRISETDPRRVAPGTNRQPTPATVMGAIMAKQARGEPLTPAEQRTIDAARAPRGRRAGRAGGGAGEGTVIVNPTTGQRMRLQGGQWIPG